MDIKHIVGPGPYYTNTFLLMDGGQGTVIDPAADARQYIELLEKAGVQLDKIILTHGHDDHTGAVEALRRATGAVLWAHPADGVLFGYKEDCPLSDGMQIPTGDETLTVYHTPGHSPGSCCLRLGDGLLFAGDTLFSGSIGRTDLAGGSYDTIMASLKRLAGMGLPSEIQVLPGHGPFSTFGQELATNPFLRGLGKGDQA